MMLVLTGIMLLAPPEALAACCTCMRPRAAQPITRNLGVEQRQPSPPPPPDPQPDVTAASDRHTGREVAQSEPSLELVGGAGITALAQSMPSVKNMANWVSGEGEGQGSPKDTLWNKLRVNLTAGVEAARATIDPLSPKGSPGVGDNQRHYDQLPEGSAPPPSGSFDAAATLGSNSSSREKMDSGQATNRV